MNADQWEAFGVDLQKNDKNQRLTEGYTKPWQGIVPPFGDHRTSADAVNVPQPALDLGHSRQQHRGIARFLAGIRQQVAITDREFLKSMIPHYASAIRKKAEPKGPEIKKLRAEIVASQQAEIEQMTGLLREGS